MLSRLLFCLVFRFLQHFLRFILPHSTHSQTQPHTQRYIRRHAHTDNQSHTHIRTLFVLPFCASTLLLLLLLLFVCYFDMVVPLTHCTVPSDGRVRRRERGKEQERAFIFSVFLLNLPLLSCSGFA